MPDSLVILSPHGIERYGLALSVVFYLFLSVVAWKGLASRLGRTCLGGACLVTAARGVGALVPVGPIGLLVLELGRASALVLVLLLSGVGDKGIARRRVGGLPLLILVGAVLCVPLAGAGFALADPHRAWTYGAVLHILLDVALILLVESLLHGSVEQANTPERIFFLTLGGLGIFDLFYYVRLILVGEVDPWFDATRSVVIALSALVLAGVMLWPGRRPFGLSRRMVFQSTMLIGAGTYLILMSFLGTYLRLWSDDWGRTAQVLFLGLAATLLLLVLRSASVRARLSVLIGKHFFRLKYDYREVWLNFIGKMASPNSTVSLQNRALQAVAEAVHCQGGVLWILQRPIDLYTAAATLNLTTDVPTIAGDEPLIGFLNRTGWIIDIGECLAEPERYDGLILPAWFAETPRLWVIVPLLHNRVLEAVMVLGQARSAPRCLGWEEFDLLKTVGAQVAGYLAEERASRELMDTRRLAEFNRRFAFVVHDIKNVVTQLSLMVQNAEQHGADPCFQEDIIVTVADAAQRLKTMLVHLGKESDGGRRDLPLAGFDLGAVGAAVARHWRTSFPTLIFKAPPDEVAVVGASEQLAVALDHLIQNAIDAAGPRGRVVLEVRACADSGVIEVVDDGPGMTPEFVRDRLFRPLETSKPQGSGVGAYQAMQLIRDMKGRLEVETRPGTGTSMRIRLARLPVGTTADSVKAEV
ncbi:XrtA/PEP-CTERM system histidine kinase PrsK [Pararhodospirillum oryzae]|uniref:histidine kinase n=1 Tax=Pararhodospirillum oryzae TaxID=478448 RepID=A0A512H3U2_9PROT|nr:XrtA/PEP-CTERM system histidine kinase PrsK [Pararhodospirillum oryzae]GEO80134.1 histidine kinase [Pararhodospirillum oryzae]